MRAYSEMCFIRTSMTAPDRIDQIRSGHRLFESTCKFLLLRRTRLRRPCTSAQETILLPGTSASPPSQRKTPRGKIADYSHLPIPSWRYEVHPLPTTRVYRVQPQPKTTNGSSSTKHRPQAQVPFRPNPSKQSVLNATRVPRGGNPCDFLRRRTR
jgi:hypothetical protein